MAKGSETTPIEATSPQPLSPERGRNSDSIDCDELYYSPVRMETTVEEDDYKMALLWHLKPDRERDTAIRAFSSHEENFEGNHDISELTLPFAPADAKIGNTGSVTNLEELGQEAESKPKPETEHDVEMQDTIMVDMSIEMHLPVALESELARQNSVILDNMLERQETGLTFPFDVTSFPIWNNIREHEDKLYWALKAAGPSEIPRDDQVLPPDHDGDCASQHVKGN